MNTKQEAMLSGAATILLLFTTMIDSLASASLAVLMLVVFTIYKYRQSRKRR